MREKFILLALFLLSCYYLFTHLQLCELCQSVQLHRNLDKFAVSDKREIALFDLAVHVNRGRGSCEWFPFHKILFKLVEVYSIYCQLHFSFFVFSKQYFKILVHVLKSVFKARIIQIVTLEELFGIFILLYFFVRSAFVLFLALCFFESLIFSCDLLLFFLELCNLVFVFSYLAFELSDFVLIVVVEIAFILSGKSLPRFLRGIATNSLVYSHLQ